MTIETAEDEAQTESVASDQGAATTRAPMGRLRRALDLTGRTLIVLGVVVLLFTAYQIWGTSLQEAHTQAHLRSTLIQSSGVSNQQEIRHALAEAAALDKLPTGPPVTAPHTNDPAEGVPVGQITIPAIGVNQIVVEGTNTPDLRMGPGHYTGTPLPGQPGNVAIAGHRTTYGHPFYNLDGVKPGDPIVLTTLQGIFVYDAFRTVVVSPNDSSVVNNVLANWLTLTTCNPRFSASTRLVVQAKLAHSQLFPNSPLAASTTHPKATSKANSQNQGLAGNSSGTWGPVIAWGLAALAVGALTLVLGRRFHRLRWLTWVVGSVAILIVLYPLFGAVSPLLPASF